MQIKLGEKIKELRKRDGRKQEDLAVAIGVTNQAVSRWEASGGYPDIEMIPAIANFFHITIDELFGYDNDRQTKLQSYMDQADQMMDTILKQEDSELRVELLRNEISEFPSEWQIQYRLADALLSMGAEKCKLPVTVTERSGDVRYNTENNAQNECWKEAVSLYEEVLKKEIDDDSHMSAISSLMWLYSLMGEPENAERTALFQSPVSISREVLLAEASKNEKTEEYRAEAILALLHELYRVTGDSVMAKHSLSHLQAGLGTLLAIVRLYESIFDGGNYGIYHNDMCMLYLNCSSIAVALNESERALKYFETALEHFLGFRQVCERTRFAAPLINKAKNYKPSIVRMDCKWFEEHMQSFPAECVETIRSNPKYASIFAR